MRRPEPDLVKLAEKYVGQWVAVDDAGSVVESGASPREVMEAAETDGVSLPLVLYFSDDYGRLAPSYA